MRIGTILRGRFDSRMERELSEVRMKVCTKCGLQKDEEKDFTWSIKGVKRHSACNQCRSKQRKEYYERNKKKELKYKYERQANKREVARHFIFTYLSSHPCVDCGQSDPMILTFDHVRGSKKMNISQMVNQGYSLETIRYEIEKCEVRCGNCHMRKEKERRGTIYW